MPSTVNKGYAVPTTGSEVGTWGDDINTNSFAKIDTNMGGVVSKTVAGSDITLNSTEAQNVIVRLTGAQSASIQLTNPNIGFYFVENLTTNSFTITVTNGVAGVAVPKGRSTVIADATNGCRIASTDSLPSGTSQAFSQTSAPTGWTKDSSSTYSDAAIRLTTGTASSGGSALFSAAFASQTPSGTVGGTTLTVAQIPSHDHYVASASSTGSGVGKPTASSYMAYQGNGSTADANWYTLAGIGTVPTIAPCSPTGGGNSHNHTFTGNAINLAVKYADFIVAVKN